MKWTELEMRGQQATREVNSAQVSHLLGRLIAAQETERSRIARDLHDDVSQRIAGLLIMISGATRMVRGKPDEADLMTALTAMHQDAMGLADAIRDLSRDLHPALLQHAGLDTALRAYCAQFQKLHGVDVTYRADAGIARTGGDMALCLYRIAQEGLGNVAKHAHARSVRVTLTQTVDGVQLSIVDDGRGFDLAVARGHGRGLGLVSIDERARLLRGSVRFETKPQQGTCVRVEIPWPVEIVCSPGRRQLVDCCTVAANLISIGTVGRKISDQQVGNRSVTSRGPGLRGSASESHR